MCCACTCSERRCCSLGGGGGVAPPQDYEKHGVYDMADKQALFKVIKDLTTEDFTLSPEPSSNAVSHANSSPDPAARYRGGGADADDLDDDGVALLDLEGEEDDDDDDFLADQLDAEAFSQAFLRNTTPERGGPLLGGASSAANSAAASTTNAPGGGGAAAAAGLVRTQSTAASGATTSAAGEDDAASLAAIADPPRIRVIVRKRPLNRKERERGEADVLECDAGEKRRYILYFFLGLVLLCPYYFTLFLIRTIVQVLTLAPSSSHSS